jgi:hypothetical protein
MDMGKTEGRGRGKKGDLPSDSLRRPDPYLNINGVRKEDICLRRAPLLDIDNCPISPTFRAGDIGLPKGQLTSIDNSPSFAILI